MMALRATAIAVLGTLGVALAGGVAWAGTDDDPGDAGFWYMSATGIEQAQAAGATGEGITIAILDGPIYPELPELVGSNLVVQKNSYCDRDGDGVLDPAVATDQRAMHASGMAALIVGTGAPTDGRPGIRGVAPGAKVRHYAIESDWAASHLMCEFDGRMSVSRALEQALDDGADIVSMSFGGTHWSSEADAVVARAVREGVILLGASDHQGGTLLGYPAQYNGAIGVEAANSAGERPATAVVSPYLDIVAPGEGALVHEYDEATGTWTRYTSRAGTSGATAITAGVLALAWSMHPEATGNQMIQALVRTTTQNRGELHRIDDAWGYGLINVNNLMSVDPTEYPDRNPLISTDLAATPDITQIFPQETAEPTPTVEPTAEPTVEASVPALDVADDEAGGGLSPAILVGGGAALLLVVAATALLVARGRKTSTPPAPGAPLMPGPPPPGQYRA